MPEKPRAEQSHLGTASQYTENNQSEEGGKSVDNGTVYKTKRPQTKPYI